MMQLANLEIRPPIRLRLAVEIIPSIKGQAQKTFQNRMHLVFLVRKLKYISPQNIGRAITATGVLYPSVLAVQVEAFQYCWANFVLTERMAEH
jgi:hypothetical protein